MKGDTESTYAAMRAYIDVAVELKVEKRMNEIRATLPTQTRAAEPVAAVHGKDGRDGIDGKDGKDGALGEKGPPGERGADGIQGRDGAPGRDGTAGTPGEKGERGADGIATLADLDARVEARFADVQARTFADVYQGVYENGKLYTRGLLATWGGSLWLSLNDTNAKPGETADWRLVVKKGADGRK